jgi:hypothetical protein
VRRKIQLTALILFGALGLAMSAVGPTAFLHGTDAGSQERPRQVSRSFTVAASPRASIAAADSITRRSVAPKARWPSIILSFTAPRGIDRRAPASVRGPPSRARRC